MVEYTQEPVRSRRGAPRLVIAAEVVEWCRHSYEHDIRIQIPLAEGHEDAPAFLRMLRIHASREGKAIDTEFLNLDGVDYLRFQMRDKKVYNRAPLPKEQ